VTALPEGFLALPAARDRSFAVVHRKVRLLAARTLLTLPAEELRGGPARSLPRLQAVLADLLRAAPDVVLEAIGSPDVLVPLLACTSGALPAGLAIEAAVPPLLVGLGARPGTLRESVLWEGPFGPLVDSIGGAVAAFSEPGRALLADPAGVEVELEGGRRLRLEDGILTRPFHPICPTHPRCVLSEIDTNPLALVEDHPDKAGNALDLGGRTPSQWVEALAEAARLIELALPSWYAELGTALRRVVPVGFEPERHLSASYREGPGLAYLTLHPDPVTLAEAIVHESQHGKLNALSWLDPVLRNGRTFWTSSPVRPDLRPLHGVLLAVHAFVPVAALHLGLARADHPAARTDRFAIRRTQVLAGNARGLALVQTHGDPTPIGRRVVDALQALHDALVRATPALDLDPQALPPG
jgi:HEXXH motif-containing protein